LHFLDKNAPIILPTRHSFSQKWCQLFLNKLFSSSNIDEKIFHESLFQIMMFFHIVIYLTSYCFKTRLGGMNILFLIKIYKFPIIVGSKIIIIPSQYKMVLQPHFVSLVGQYLSSDLVTSRTSYWDPLWGSFLRTRCLRIHDSYGSLPLFFQLGSKYFTIEMSGNWLTMEIPFASCLEYRNRAYWLLYQRHHSLCPPAEF